MMYTTCCTRLASPGRCGTARAATLARGATDGGAVVPLARCHRLFSATLTVYADSSASVGTAMTFTEPRSAKT